MKQITLDDVLYEEYKFPKNKKIRLIECFAGIGAQAAALKKLGLPFEHYKTVEWAIPSIKAYPSIHRDNLPDYGEDFCSDLNKDELVRELYTAGVSADYNKPATIEQLRRKPIEELRLIFNSIYWGNNLVDIARVHAEDLKIVDKEHFTYLLTYSFPCQNLSVAGRQDNLKNRHEITKDNLYDIENRSNMLWQVERILYEGARPDVLLMENVPQVCGKKNLPLFQTWQHSLEKLGYKNYYKVINAKEQGIPQSRNRCYMISILGDYVYHFPKKKKLKLCLEDMLEDNSQVDDSYNLSEGMIKCFTAENTGKYDRKNVFMRNFEDGPVRKVAAAVLTTAGQRPVDNFVMRLGNYSPSGHNAASIVHVGGG